jgi:hypothetical protein
MPKRETRETPRIVLNYLRLIREKEYPYYLVAKRLVDDAEAYYKPRSPEQVIYTLNPKWLHRELTKEVKHEKLTVMNISRIIKAFLHGKRLEYYTTTGSGGCKSYHIELNPTVVKALKPDEEERA